MLEPEKIKRGLWHCANENRCEGCPYHGEDCVMAEDFGVLAAESLAYIEQLEREKAALLEIADKACRYCKHDHDLSANSPCNKCTTKNVLWEWRGVEGTE